MITEATILITIEHIGSMGATKAGDLSLKFKSEDFQKVVLHVREDRGAQILRGATGLDVGY